MTDISIEIATSLADVSAVESIFHEYLIYLDRFVHGATDNQDNRTEFSDLTDYYDFILLAKLDKNPVAACGVKHLKSSICEIKRLYARPEGRGLRLGHKLAQRAMAEAKSRGYKHMYLHTDPALKQALIVYQNLGFEPTSQYYDYPEGSSIYMKKSL